MVLQIIEFLCDYFGSGQPGTLYYSMVMPLRLSLLQPAHHLLMVYYLLTNCLCFCYNDVSLFNYLFWMHPLS